MNGSEKNLSVRAVGAMSNYLSRLYAGAPFQELKAAAKGAVIAFTFDAAAELGPHLHILSGSRLHRLLAVVTQLPHQPLGQDAVERRADQGRPTGPIAGVDVGARLNQLLRGLPVAVVRRDTQRRAAAIVRGVDVGSRLDDLAAAARDVGQDNRDSTAGTSAPSRAGGIINQGATSAASFCPRARRLTLRLHAASESK